VRLPIEVQQAASPPEPEPIPELAKPPTGVNKPRKSVAARKEYKPEYGVVTICPDEPTNELAYGLLAKLLAEDPRMSGCKLRVMVI
jgi:hypothetical protein